MKTVYRVRIVTLPPFAYSVQSLGWICERDKPALQGVRIDAASALKLESIDEAWQVGYDFCAERTGNLIRFDIDPTEVASD